MKKLNLTIKDMPYAAEEALNRLRVNIKFCGKNTKKIVVTSSVPDEGKSTVSMRLWKLLAEAGFPTVLVDVDLRKSEVKTKYRVKGIQEGLNHYLSGLAEYEDVVYETNIPNGHMVPISTLLENPSALLEDPRLGELLDKLAEDYRYVIIDTPPLDSISDGALLASMADGAVLVVRCGETSKTLVRQSLQQLDRVGCPVLGTVLNRAEIKSGAYRKYYGRYGKQYGYYYGEKSSDKNSKSKPVNKLSNKSGNKAGSKIKK